MFRWRSVKNDPRGGVAYRGTKRNKKKTAREIYSAVTRPSGSWPTIVFRVHRFFFLSLRGRLNHCSFEELFYCTSSNEPEKK